MSASRKRCANISRPPERGRVLINARCPLAGGSGHTREASLYPLTTRVQESVYPYRPDVSLSDSRDWMLPPRANWTHWSTMLTNEYSKIVKKRPCKTIEKRKIYNPY